MRDNRWATLTRFAIGLFLLAAFTFLASSAIAETIWLSTLDLKHMTSGWSEAKTDLSIAGKPLSIGGKKFSRGVGTHADSTFRLKLDGRAKRFSAQVGVDDSAGNHGSVEFIVIGDRRVLWQSALLTGGQAAIPVDVDLRGVQTLILQVSDGGDGADSDHADWADARIDMDGALPPRPLAPFEQITLKTAHFDIDFRIGNDGRLYQQPVGSTQSLKSPERLDEAYPQAGDGYIWEPALQTIHSDGNTSTKLMFEAVTRTHESPARESVRIKLRDPAYPFDVTLCFRTHRDWDLIEQWAEITHQESRPVKLERTASTSLLLPATNLYLMHFFGDWAKEMNPTTELLTPGIKILDSKIGVRAHQFQNPSFVLSLGGPPSETNGPVLGGSLAWSGSFQCAFDHNGKRVRALCGINPFASTYYLKPNETFVTPAMLWVWSEHGLGEMSRRFHDWAREYGIRDGQEPRTVLLNNWEATGFNFDFNRIVGLFDPAKELGTELFLLDDGWFGNKYPRVNDRAGLGDWQPNRKRLPDGLAPLAADAAKRGLQFGIWLEPEMVNPKSELFEKHPDWVIRQPKRDLELLRNQLVLDLTRPAVQKFEWDTIKSILSTPGISYAKWDCNRYLTQPASSWLPPDRQSHLWIDYVRALYALMDKTAKTFPKTELMLCSGGGGRVDYGALRYFHEFWPSDNTDPLVRIPMQWNYSYFFPPMAIAGHVTPSGNRPMHFACAVAMSVRYGMDLDLTKLSTADKAVCAGAIKAYKRIRDVTQLGDLYRLENPYDSIRSALNFVSKDRQHAALFVFQMKDGERQPVHPQGLVPEKEYAVRELNPLPGRTALAEEGKSIRGEILMRDGMLLTCSKAAEACVVELTAQAN